MIYLDTHVVVWLFSGLTDKFSATAQKLINDNEIYISPVVRLELQYLFEIQRVAEAPDTVVTDLANRIGLQVCTRPFNRIVTQALTCTWTRDPFDRLITANAALHDNVLLSKDRNILEHYAHARWDQQDRWSHAQPNLVLTPGVSTA
ncbi:MAG TPA: PIN domain-containing protein [Anaerolineae bacterium]|nr:PIN domain-containing protein [Anaerolineae bacterium]